MIKDFDFNNPLRETYILTWPILRRWGRTGKSGFYRRPLNATIGRSGFKDHKHGNFFCTIGDESAKINNLTWVTSSLARSHHLNGTILEVPDIDDVVCLRMMDPSELICNNEIDFTDEDLAKYYYPHIYHVTPELIKLSTRIILAEAKTREISRKTSNGDYELSSIVENIDKILGDKTNLAFNSPKISGVKKNLKSIISELKSLEEEQDRREERLQQRLGWLETKLETIWDNAKFGANNYS